MTRRPACAKMLLIVVRDVDVVELRSKMHGLGRDDAAEAPVFRVSVLPNLEVGRARICTGEEPHRERVLTCSPIDGVVIFLLGGISSSATRP
jgi:hypothetical protein